jgi:hypothetical protein
MKRFVRSNLTGADFVSPREVWITASTNVTEDESFKKSFTFHEYDAQGIKVLRAILKSLTNVEVVAYVGGSGKGGEVVETSA